MDDDVLHCPIRVIPLISISLIFLLSLLIRISCFVQVNLISACIKEKFFFYKRSIEGLRKHAKVWEAHCEGALSDKKTYEMLACLNKDEIEELRKEADK